MRYFIDKVVGVTAKDAQGLIRSTGKRMFGDAYYYAYTYDRETKTLKYVLARENIPAYAQPLVSPEKYALSEGSLFLLICDATCEIAPHLPGDYLPLEDVETDKNTPKMSFSHPLNQGIPVLLIFAITIFLLVAYDVVLRENLRKINNSIKAAKPAATAPAARNNEVPDVSSMIDKVWVDINGKGILQRFQLKKGSTKPEYEVEFTSTIDALDYAKKHQGEVKDLVVTVGNKAAGKPADNKKKNEKDEKKNGKGEKN